jgi:DNA polymerase epsilon subunit 1
VPLHAADTRCGQWYDVRITGGVVTLQHRADLLLFAEMRVCAFDIECTKMPLQFPNSSTDQIFMISYMCDGAGFLIINREVVSADISDFEYTPKPEYRGPFKVFNERDEKALLRRFFDHMRVLRPCIYVTYNGDSFDWPFIADRAERYGWTTDAELGIKVDKVSGEARGRAVVHMDAFAWVKRDSYLPQGSQGLKAVTRYKLGYDPVEVDPELMVRYAQERPQHMAAYSVSDAVCTYYLYQTYVHPFIFSLCKIIPMSPDEVLRKGSGTLCEALLMVEAFKGNIVAPNKQTNGGDKYHNGRLLESETYIGGHVECLESGVFREDIPCRFNLKPAALQKLIDEVDIDLEYALRTEAQLAPEEIQNYAEIRAAIVSKLEQLRDTPKREECPLIYHLDVAAMYPNIILTNRLQPPAIVTEDVCAACDFNVPGKQCLRSMEWVWRGETYTASRAEVAHLRAQLEVESFPDPGAGAGAPLRRWRDLSGEDRDRLLKERLKKYCQRVYKRVLDKPSTVTKLAGVCQRENPFYADTVRGFRDRRYEYKALHKKWKDNLVAAKASGTPASVAEAAGMVVLYDSLQLAHKCILNSFYGYVMRRGARWYSMEMAGVVTYTGANIIQRARQLVEQLGKPLELDTDGIWCCLPKSFPENFEPRRLSDGQRACVLSYPCIILNRMVAVHNTNDQYARLVDPVKREYKVSSEMSIAFEVDGPYRAMILPASKEEDKLIKKRYAVFDRHGHLAELKGFEMKRRGELKLIKVFQTEVFGAFLQGHSLETCYAAVAAIANRWLDMLENQGVDLNDEDLLELISESTVMSKSVEEYGDRKSAAITTAARLAQFLGDERLKDRGLKCEYIVASKPAGAPTSERCIPALIFSCEPAVARSMLRKWTRDSVPGEPGSRPDPRSLIDWSYYITRLGGAIQKIITIPAALQRVPNPVPRVAHPDWLARKARERNDPNRQIDIRDVFAPAPAGHAAFGDDGGACAPDENTAPGAEPMDLEDVGGGGNLHRAGTRPVVRRMSRPLAEAGAAIEPAVEPETPCPDKEQDYGAWLAHAKRKWSSTRAARKKARLAQARAAGGGGAAMAALQAADEDYDDGPGTGVGAFFRKADAAAIAASHWQLLQLAPMAGAPGSYSAWVMVGGVAMYAVPLKVPRTLLVSLARPDVAADAGFAAPKRVRVAKHLPHAAPWNNLYAVTLDERDFDRAGVVASACHAGSAVVAGNAAGVDPVDVLGVFESQLPLQEHAILQLGCCVAVAPTAKRRPLGQGYALGELEMRTTAVCPYDTRRLRYVALYGAHVGAAGGERRGMFALLMPTGANTSRCVLVVTQRRGSRDVTPPASARALRAALGGDDESAVAAALRQAPELEDCSFEVVYVRTHQEAASAVARALGEHTSTNRGPCVALAESAASDAELLKDVPLLGRDLPLVRVPHNAADVETLGDGSAASLGWQGRLLRVALARLASAGPWMVERAALAAYAHVPLANLGTDWVITAADAFFGRALRDAQHVLWSSPTGEPDLGGGSADAAGAPLGGSALALTGAMLSPDDDGATDDVAAVSGGGASGAASEDGACHASVPGAYRSACVELRLHNLAVCAIVNAHLLPEIGVGMDGDAPAAPAAATDGSAGASKAQLGGAHAAAGAFRVLRGMVTAWVADAQRGNAYADTLLTQLYRWLSSPQSTLRDPALLRLVRLAMRRVFRSLLSELQRLGAKVVYADFGIIWLATGKSTPAAAAAFVDGLRAAVQQRELFSWLGLVPTRTWHALLFHDLHNFGGVEAVKPARNGAAEEGDDGQEAPSAQDWSPVSHWTMAQYLPPALQEVFELTVSEFILLPWKNVRDEAAAAAAVAMDEHASGDADAASAAHAGAVAPATAAAAAAAAAAADESASARAAGELINTYFTHRLIRMTKDIVDALGDGRTARDGATPLPPGDAAAFPSMPGSHLTPEQLGTPALAFVRSVCEVFALDTRAEAQVGLLRAQLLRLLRVREFSGEAEWVDPCASFTLRDVLCGYCHRLRDLDLCRDAQLAQGDWRCDHPGCRHPYDVAALEARLVAAARGAVRAFVLQDLTCSRPGCRRVKQAHLAARCACGGPFACRLAPQDARRRLHVLHRVATFHGFRLLEEVTCFALGVPFSDPVPAAGEDTGAASDDDADEDMSEENDETRREAQRAALARRLAADSEDDDAPIDAEEEEDAPRAVPVGRRPPTSNTAAAPRQRQVAAAPPRPGGRKRREALVLDDSEDDDAIETSE